MLLTAQPARATDAGRLVSSSPADAVRLASAPRDVQLTFSLWPTLESWVTVTGPAGVVASGRPHLLGSIADQALPDRLPNGDYTVLYYADFGLLGSTTGTVDFAVGPVPSPSPSPSPSTRPSSPAATTPPHPSATRSAPTTPAPQPSAQASTSAAAVPSAGGPGAGPGDGRGADLVALGAIRPSASMPSRGWPWPPPLLLAGLLVALAVFGADRWRTVRVDRTQLQEATTVSAGAGRRA